jgi:hypothetical protein
VVDVDLFVFGCLVTLVVGAAFVVASLRLD